jgi:hypothetical protein
MPSYTHMLGRCNGRHFVVEKEWKAVRTAGKKRTHAPSPSASLQLYMTRQVVHMASLDLDERRLS